MVNFVSGTSPWAHRSGGFYYGTGTGLGSFNVATGANVDTLGYRIVLNP